MEPGPELELELELEGVQAPEVLWVGRAGSAGPALALAPPPAAPGAG
jgi:hypothetical protein